MDDSWGWLYGGGGWEHIACRRAIPRQCPPPLLAGLRSLSAQARSYRQRLALCSVRGARGCSARNRRTYDITPEELKGWRRGTAPGVVTDIHLWCDAAPRPS